MFSSLFHRAAVAPLLFALGLSGCASVPADWGRSEAARLAAERGRNTPQPADTVAWTRDALAQPLTPQAAAQLALLHNPDLRLRNARLGIAQADLYEAGRLANPVISATDLSGDSGPHSRLTLGIGFDIVRLLTLPATRRNAQAGVDAARLEVGGAIVELATQAERDWFAAAAAAQGAQVRELSADAARASGELAQRYFDAGNINRRQLNLEQAEASSLRLDLLAAQSEAATARAALNRRMGQRDDDAWTLTELPEVPQHDPALDELLRQAVESRLDIAAAQSEVLAVAGRYRLTRRTRLIGEVQIGAEREREYDGAINAGPSVSMSLPLFDWGGGRKARAQAELDIAEAHLDGLVLDAHNDVRAAYARLQLARERASAYREQLIPQREAVVAFLQQEVNYMLAGVFELLVARRQTYDAYAGYIDAVRDYWLARCDLTQAVGRVLPLETTAITPPAVGAEADRAPVPESSGGSPTDVPAESHAHHHHAPAGPAEPNGDAP